MIGNRLRTAVAFLLCACGALPGAPALAATTFVAAGSSWKYLDNGSDQGTAWRAAAFDDSSWASGPAELGYGDGDEATVVSYGPNASNKYVTTYFRHTFSVTGAASYVGLDLSLLRDDGAVVYLNGTEVHRSNMPAGAIGYTTLASSALGAPAESTFVQTAISASALLEGTNILAVEVHQANVTSSDLSFNLVLTGSTAVQVARGPYLQKGTPSSVVVRWRTNVATDSRVRYGSSPGSLGSTVDDAASVTEHVVALSGLSPDTRYYYSIGSSTETLAGDDADHFFVTSPTTGTAKATRLWVLGDSGTADGNARAVRDAYDSFNGTGATDLWLMLGDNAYYSGTDAEYQAAVFQTYPKWLRTSVLWPTLGNHDGASADSATQTGVYYDIFTLPTAGEAGGQPSGTEAYYSFDYGNIHFICLDSHETDRSPAGAMMQWLEDDLQAATADWVIAFWHHPPYSKGSHDSDSESQLIDMRQNALPLLESYGVDLVLSGHSHAYERSVLLDGHYGDSSTLTGAMKLDAGSGRPDGDGAYHKATTGPAPHEGAVYVVAGSSGMTSGGTLNHPVMYVSLNVLGSLVLDVSGDTLDAKFLTSTGAVNDYFTIVKGPLATETATDTATATHTATVTETSASTATATQTDTAPSSPTATVTATASPAPTDTSSATVTDTPTTSPTPTLYIGGTVLHSGSGNPVASVTVDGAEAFGDAPSVSVSTDAAGAFAMGGVPGGPWAIRPHLTDTAASIQRGLSSLDASWIQQYVVSTRSFDDNQLLAADTTGNGTISSLDATRVQEYRVTIISRLPVAANCQSDWAFVPVPGPAGEPTPIPPHITAPCTVGGISYASLSGSATGQDFEAVLFGDVTENWSPAGGGGSAALDELVPGGELVGDRAPEPVAEVLVPLPNCAGPCAALVPADPGAGGCGSRDWVLAANHLDGVQGIDLAVDLPAGVTAADVRKAGLTAGGECSLVWASSGGRVKISLACLRPIAGGGGLVALTLRGAAGARGEADVSTCVFDEGEVPCETRGARLEFGDCAAP